MHLALHPIWSWPLVAAGGVTLATTVVWIYRATLAESSGGWRWLAFGLRLLALLMLLAAMLRPSLVFSEKRKQSASLILLSDHSRSMLVADAWDALPRWQAMNQTLAKADPPLKKLADLLEIRQFQFDSKITETLNLNEPPTGNQTAIGDVLREAVRRAPGRVAAVVLLSDGANTTGTPPMSVAENLKDLGVPLYTVGFGAAAAVDTSRDLAMRTISAGPTVFEKNKLTVTGDLDARGFAGQKVQLKLMFDGRQADTKTIELPQDQERQKIELGYVPTVPGEHRVTLVVSEQEPKKGELVETNNEISSWVTVLKGGLRVQYLDGGTGSVEPKLIRAALDTAADIKVDFVWVRGPIAEPPPGRVNEAGAGEEGVAALFDRNRYDVFFLRDVPRSWIPDAALERLKRAVESGAGLAMLGGRQSFGPGGYSGTPVADVLPVTIHPGDQQINKPQQVVPTAQGLGHFVMRLGVEGDARQIWQSLLPLDGASSFTDVKPQGRVLAETPDHVPLIVAQDFGQGRSTAIAIDSTWLWRTKSDESAKLHRRFWRQVILWLARKEQAGESRVWVELAKRRVAVGEPLEVTVGAEDEHGNPLADTTFEVTVTPPDSKPAPLQVLPQADRTRGTFYGTQKAGDYEVSVTARRGGDVLGPPRQAKFLAFEDESELTAPAADIALLTQMADLTGGRYVQPERLAAFLEELRHQDLHLEVERLTHYRLWDNWPFLLLFVTLLSAEWGLRKWKGQV